eukprot:scaffold212204_cov26-Tisochrysis_lutea.AAC.1
MDRLAVTNEVDGLLRQQRKQSIPPWTTAGRTSSASTLNESFAWPYPNTIATAIRDRRLREGKITTWNRMSRESSTRDATRGRSRRMDSARVRARRAGDMLTKINRTFQTWAAAAQDCNLLDYSSIATVSTRDRSRVGGPGKSSKLVKLL